MHIIGGQYKRKKILTPKGMDIRPTSSRLREALFNICQDMIEGAQFLDLFAGSGAVGLEALSRGAAHCTFVDTLPDSVKCINLNVKSLGVVDQSIVIKDDVLKWLSYQKKSFDIIYVDPPYEVKDFSKKVLHIIDQSQILNEGGNLFLEDVASALEVDEPLKTLEVKSKRNTGRSSLHQYIKMR